jgi:hypothetical protein
MLLDSTLLIGSLPVKMDIEVFETTDIQLAVIQRQLDEVV